MAVPFFFILLRSCSYVRFLVIIFWPRADSSVLGAAQLFGDYAQGAANGTIFFVCNMKRREYESEPTSKQVGDADADYDGVVGENGDLAGSPSGPCSICGSTRGNAQPPASRLSEPLLSSDV